MAANMDDLRVKTEDQLSGDLAELKREAFNLRFQAATNQLERPARIREVRRDIARIKTLQNERSAKSDRGQSERTSAADKKA
ncbi:MAG: 50S ribosomal protein L29 [Burkholderiaceae bacterium]